MILRWFAAAVLVGGLWSSLIAVKAEEPSLQRGASVSYRCSGGERLEATYYELRDRSLAFVRLRLPDGRRLSLPQIMSASGARFSADSDFTWWIKGDSGFLEQRDSLGEWRVKLKDCDSLIDAEALQSRTSSRSVPLRSIS